VALTDNYTDVVPVDLVLACGIFGNININDNDIAATVCAMPAFLAPGGTVIWTRHRWTPDLVPAIDGLFADAGFARAFLSEPDHSYGVGVHRLTASPPPLSRSAWRAPLHVHTLTPMSRGQITISLVTKPSTVTSPRTDVGRASKCV
jgi:hypothetical protein